MDDFEFKADLATDEVGGNDGKGKIDTAAVVTAGDFGQLNDINTDAFQGSDPSDLTLYDGTVYFSANDGTGATLWRITAAGQPDEVDVASGSANPENLTVFDGELYFTSGGSLWHTDGTDAPQETQRSVQSFASISALTAGADMLGVVSRDGVNDFLAIVPADGATQDVGQKVPVTDASNLTDWEYGVDQHALVYVVDNGATYSLQSTAHESAIMTGSAAIIANLTGVGGNLFFTVGGKSLYVSDDGAAAVEVETYSYLLEHLTAVGDTLFFVYDSGTTDVLHVYNLETDLATGPLSIKRLSGDASSMTDVNGTLFFKLGSDRGTSLWRSDGTAVGTVQVTYVENDVTSPVSNPADMVVLSGSLYFTSPNGSGQTSLWKSEFDADTSKWVTGRMETFGGVPLPVITVEVLAGEGDGMVTVSDFTAPALAAYTTGLNQEYLDLTMVVREFLASGKTWLTIRLQSDSEITLQRARSASDSATGLIVETVQRTGVVADLYTDEGRLLIEGRSIVDLSQFPAGTYFLRVYDPAGTIDTEKVLNDQGNQIGSPTLLTAAGDMAYFVHEDKLWRTNGVSVVEIKIAGIPNTSLSSPADLIGVGETLFFTVGTNLWKTDGVFAELVDALAGEPDDTLCQRRNGCRCGGKYRRKGSGPYR
jgi:ELWxxDGT repeat protein